MAKNLFENIQARNVEERRKTIQTDIEKAFKDGNYHQFYHADQKNVLLIGRTRSGKSTIKAVLTDPTKHAPDLTLGYGTKEAMFESFIADKDKTVINIIDTPGLFETGSKDASLRDNPTIITTIKRCIEREITKFHLVCFCASFESGVNEQDVKAIEELATFLGKDVSRVSCLIITRCESKSEEQRKALVKEVKDHGMFQSIRDYFGERILFSGALSYESWNNATDDLYPQFNNIIYYREQIISLIKNSSEPLALDQTKIKEFVEPKTGKNRGDCLIA